METKTLTDTGIEHFSHQVAKHVIRSRGETNYLMLTETELAVILAESIKVFIRQ